MIKKVLQVDEKILTPLDTAKTENITEEEFNKHYNKPVRGYVVISDQDGKVLETPNLVLLSGREFIAQKLADITSASLLPAGNDDLTNFKIRYFGVGTGGADASSTPNKIGPFDNELDLRKPGKFADVSIDTDTTPVLSTRYQYINNGKLKKIQSDLGGAIEIVKESHNILINGSEVTIDAMTTIKYTLIVRKDELYKKSTQSGPFAFNEAALYAVEYEDGVVSTDGLKYSIPASTDGTELARYSPRVKCFARFTALTKWLEEQDSLKIEWYILT